MDVAIETADTLLPLQHRPIELGRIRTGARTEKGYPTRLETFRLTSGSQALLAAAASLYGGEVRPWTDAPDEGYFELVTQSRELRVLIPRDLRTVSQSYEFWQGGTCERRCDGTTEQITDGPCVCPAIANPDDRCDPVTRISLMLPDVPGLGVWRLDTGGWHAATSLPATISLLKQLSTASWIPAILRLEQRSKKTREADGKVVTHRFAVPVLDLPNLTIGKVVASQGTAPVPRIEDGISTAPPTAADRVSSARARIEERTTSGPVSSAGHGAEQGAEGLPSSEPPHPAEDEPGQPGEKEGGDADVSEGDAPKGQADPARPPCEAFDAEKGRCVKDEHPVPPNHRNKAGETWA